MVKWKVRFKGKEELELLDQKELEKAFKITYLPTLEYADYKLERFLHKKCSKALHKGYIGQLALWLGRLHAKELSEKTHPDIAIEWIGEIKGYGIVAHEPLRKWQYVGEYVGLVRQRKILFPDVNDYCFMYPREWLSLKAVTIDSEKEGNFTRFINHSETPNLESVAIYYEEMMHIVFRTIREIAQGEELCYNYGDIYWKKRPHKID